MIFGMLTTRFPLKRLIAALLPMSFIWLFVACVSICARESTEHANGRTSLVEMEQSSDCKGCPVTAFPKARTPERTIDSIDLQPPVALPALVLSVNDLTDEAAVFSVQRQHSSADHPLKRLRALRI